VRRVIDAPPGHHPPKTKRQMKMGNEGKKTVRINYKPGAGGADRRCQEKIFRF
jgi:hypothetical protein